MATARQIIAMLSSHNQGDQEQFLSIALQVAAAEALRGRKQVADELRQLVDAARQSQSGLPSRTQVGEIPIPISRPRGELQNLLASSYPKARLDDVVLPAETRTWLDRLLHQQKQRDKLRAHGQSPITRLLLIGCPGSGKTMTASALAGELRLPLFTIRLDAIITRYMGETASKLRLVFDQLAALRGVYLFDEFDAIGGRRNADNDVGEMRRVLNSFLQYLEEPNSTDSLIVSATNHPELLDRALFRRFDGILEYGLPDAQAIQSVLDSRLGPFRPKRIIWKPLTDAAEGLSQADLVRASDEVIKNAILREDELVSPEELLLALCERRAMRETIAGIDFNAGTPFLEGELDQADLKNAIEELPDGGTLRLGIVTIRLIEKFIITKALTIQGQGAEHSKIVSNSADEDGVLCFIGEGPWTLNHVEVSRERPTVPVAEDHLNFGVFVTNGEIHCLGSRFRGAWAGLYLAGSTVGRIADCEADRNHVGMWIEGNCSIIIVGSRLHNNKSNGLWLTEQTRCMVVGNRITENALSGIDIGKQAEPTLENNHCCKNGHNGISFDGTANGKVSKNECHENGQHGISVSEEASPTIVENVCTYNNLKGICFNDEARGLVLGNHCRRNDFGGIEVTDKSSPTLRGNNCLNNGGSGIQVREQAFPVLDSNLCRRNKHSGIHFSEDTRGLVRQNECRENGSHGIELNDQVAVTLDENSCSTNGLYGIYLDLHSRCIATSNICIENGVHGIAVEDDSIAIVERNRCERNHGHGIFYAENTAGTIRENHCVGNESHGLIVLGGANKSNNHLKGNWLNKLAKVPEALQHTVRKAYGAQPYHDFVQAFKRYPTAGPKWLDGVFDLIEEMMQTLGLGSDDPRLSLSLNLKHKLLLRVFIGRSRALTPRRDRKVELLFPLGLNGTDFGSSPTHKFDCAKVPDAQAICVPFDPSVGLPSLTKTYWLSAISNELKRTHTSRFRVDHCPLFFGAVTNRDVRRMVLRDAYSQ